MVRDSVGRRVDLVRFGVFEADLEHNQLRKFGVALKLQTQPFKILALLVSRPGEIVSREDLKSELWDSGTHVDFERGLGTAMNKLREALGDSPSAPRYIETLAKRGYRFIAPVQIVQSGAPEPEPLTAPVTPAALEEKPKRLGFLRRREFLGAGVAAGVIVLAVVLWPHRSNRGADLIRSRQVTWTGRVCTGDPDAEIFPAMVTDGARVLFPLCENGEVRIAAQMASSSNLDAPTSILPVPAEISRPSVDDISPQGAKLLVEDRTWSGLESPLWVVSSSGGAARRVGNVVAHAATWMPDNKSILFALGHELWITDEMGEPPRLFARLPGRGYWLRWPRDGSRLRLTIVDPGSRAPSIWEIALATKQPVRAFPDEADPEKRSEVGECCGSWTPNGQYVFARTMASGAQDIWIQRNALAVGEKPDLVQITAGPLHYSAPVPVGSEGDLFAIGAQGHIHLGLYNRQMQRFENLAPGFESASRLAFSNDGSRIAWISASDGSVWTSLPGGAERLQLTSPPLDVYMVVWSPDGKQLALMGKYPHEPWKIYTVLASGGPVSKLIEEDRAEADPTWSPDGKFLAYGRNAEFMGEEGADKEIYVMDLRTHEARALSQSQGLFSPRWSPDGRYIAALGLDQRSISVFDLVAGRWTTLLRRDAHNPLWSADSKSIYFQAFMEPNQPIYRIQLASGKIDRVVDFANITAVDAHNSGFVGLSRNDEPIVSIGGWTGDVFFVQHNAGNY